MGLLVAVMFAAALSSKAAELAALGTTTTIDFWRHFRPLAADDEARNVRVARRFTALWGVLRSGGFALFAGFAENLIEAINILRRQIFYGVLLGLFVVAFFLRRVGGSAVFFAAVTAQALVIAMYFSLNIGYLWYNLIGCAACIAFSVALQAVLPPRAAPTGAPDERGGWSRRPGRPERRGKGACRGPRAQRLGDASRSASSPAASSRSGSSWPRSGPRDACRRRSAGASSCTSATTATTIHARHARPCAIARRAGPRT